MSEQREERPGEGDLSTEQKKHIEQPAQKDQEQSNLQPEIQQEPDPEAEEVGLEDEEQEEDEETVNQQA